MAQDSIAYFPHAVGNVWQYRETYNNTVVRTETIIGDSVGDNGSTYVWYSKVPGFQHGYEIDTSSNVWRSSLPPPQFTRQSRLFKLNTAVGDTWTYFFYSIARVVDIYGGSVFGGSTTIKEIEYWDHLSPTDSMWYATYWIAKGFGLIRQFLEPGVTYYLAGCIIDSVQYGTIVDVPGFPPVLPRQTTLRNYPNPFNAQTAITYELERDSDVELVIYNVLGQRVRTLVHSRQKAGQHRVIFNARNIPSGVYVCVLCLGRSQLSRKILMIK